MPEKQTQVVLTEAEQARLLELARTTIEARLRGEPPPAIPPEPSRELDYGGAFVTLTVNGQLRGCIGLVRSPKSLHETIVEAAEAAAFKDPRFPPLAPKELKDVVIEISVISPPRRVAAIEEIEVGRHGLLLRCAGTQGLLLPQVAVHNRWDRDTFLDHVCLKAGLPVGAWKLPEAEIYVFEAQVFEEPHLAAAESGR